MSEGATAERLIVNEAVAIQGVAYACVFGRRDSGIVAEAGAAAGGPRDAWQLGEATLVVEAETELDESLRAHVEGLARLATRLLENERDARRDPLTGLANRRAFDEALESELGARASRDRPLALVFCDLDGFKRVNDRRGYESGDAVLCEVARVLAAHLRPGERPYRIGGDEFAILVDGGHDAALAVATRLTAALGARCRGPELPTLSSGIAVFPGDGATGSELLRHADRLLASAKHRPAVTAAPQLRVLVVDDDPSLRVLLRTTFERADLVVDEAASVEAARTAIRERPPGVIVLDVSLPGTDGLTFLRELRRNESTREIGVVLLTGSDVNERAATTAGADVLVRKPFSPLELLAAVERVTGTSSGPARLATAGERPRDQLLLYADDLRSLLDQERRRRRELERTYRDTLGALASALDSKDVGTGAHSLRVLRYATELARAAAPDLLDDPSVEYGFLLHDVGKIGIPDGILRKPAPLTADEQRVMRTHAPLGAEILSRVALLHGEGLAVVRHHHERWDGRGYPNGLARERIPLGARIFAVADALDAMTSDRPYRSAGTWEAAVAELDAEAGRQFDPRIVEAFRDREPALRAIQRELAAA